MVTGVWRHAKLEDLVFFQRGFDITQAEQRPGPYPVVSSSGITSRHDEFKVKGPGIIIGRKGTLGSIHFSAEDYWPHDTTLWSKDLKGNDHRFVFYFLHTIDFKRFDVGNSNPTLNRNHIHDLAISYPTAPTQKRIADILAAYDDLIENNLRRMALLEEAARLLYQEWFVRLRFPGHEHTPIRDGVPEGWERRCLGDLCEEIKNLVAPDDLEPDTPYIGLEHMPRRSITLSSWGRSEEVSSTKHRYQAGDVLFGKIRPYFHKVGFALTDGVASSDTIVMRPRTDDLRPLVLLTASSDLFVATTSQAVREGSKMPRADWKLMKQFPLLQPPHALLASFNDTISSITGQLKTLAFLNQKLKAARDLLLPKLMSGEIPI
jgi:type I restriction enzyme S subunit